MSSRAILQFLTVVLIWGTTWIVIKFQLGSVNPSWSVSYRFATGGVALLAWCAIKGLPLTVPRHALPFLALLGLFQFVMNFNFVYRSELYIPSGIPAVAFALLMVPNAILAWLFGLIIPAEVPTLYRTDTLITIAIFTVVAGVVGALFSLRRIARIDPATAIGGAL